MTNYVIPDRLVLWISLGESLSMAYPHLVDDPFCTCDICVRRKQAKRVIGFRLGG